MSRARERERGESAGASTTVRTEYTYEEKVDEWNGDKVDNGEDNVALVANVCDHRRGDLDDEEGEQPLRHDGQGAAAETEFQGQHLAGIDPHVGLPAESEEGLKDLW